MTKFRTAYCYWALAADCAATGDAMKLAKMTFSEMEETKDD
jgi:hypothetical protein